MKGDLTAFQKAKLLPTFKFQTANHSGVGEFGIWSLRFGICLVLGACDLVLLDYWDLEFGA
jgi:hypothetical protein